MKVVLSKRQLRRAKKQFRKQPHNTRPFTIQDYDALPKEHPYELIMARLTAHEVVMEHAV